MKYTQRADRKRLSKSIVAFRVSLQPDACFLIFSTSDIVVLRRDNTRRPTATLL